MRIYAAAWISPDVLEFHLHPGCLIGCLFGRPVNDEAGGISRYDGKSGRIGGFDESIRAEAINEKPEAEIFFAKGLSAGSRSAPATVSQNDGYRIAFRQIAVKYIDGQALLPGSDVRFRVPSTPERGAPARTYTRIVRLTGCVSLRLGPITGETSRKDDSPAIIHAVSANVVSELPRAPCACFHVTGGSEFAPSHPFANPGFTLSVSAVRCRIHYESTVLFVVV